MLRRTLTLGLAALFLTAATGANAKKKKPKKPLPPRNTPDPKTGILVEPVWDVKFGGRYLHFTGWVTNTSDRNYRSVYVTFILWAKDGDKIQEHLFNAGAMPPGTRMTMPPVELGDGRDKPDRVEVYQVSAFP